MRQKPADIRNGLTQRRANPGLPAPSGTFALNGGSSELALTWWGSARDDWRADRRMAVPHPRGRTQTWAWAVAGRGDPGGLLQRRDAGTRHEQGWRRGALLLAGGASTSTAARSRAGPGGQDVPRRRGHEGAAGPSSPANCVQVEGPLGVQEGCAASRRTEECPRESACERSLRSAGGARFNLRVPGYRGVRFLRFGDRKSVV